MRKQRKMESLGLDTDKSGMTLKLEHHSLWKLIGLSYTGMSWKEQMDICTYQSLS
jgi:hypothetical protein